MQLFHVFGSSRFYITWIMCHVQTCSDLNRRAEQNPRKTTYEHLRTMMSTKLMMNYDERTRFGYSGYSPATRDRIWTPGPEDCHLAKGRFGPGVPTQRILQCPIAVVTVCHSVTVVRICQDMSCFSLLLELILPSWGTKQGGCDTLTLTVLHKSHLRPLRKLRASCTNGKGKPERFGQWSNSGMPLCHKIGKVELYPPTNCFDPQVSTFQPQFHQASQTTQNLASSTLPRPDTSRLGHQYATVKLIPGGASGLI